MIMQEPTVETAFALLAQKVEALEEDQKACHKDLKAFIDKVEKLYLTIERFTLEFKPVRLLVYGMVAIILTIVITVGTNFVMSLISKGVNP